MRTIAAWVIGIAAIWGGLTLAGRLQRWDEATLFVQCGQTQPCVYTGPVKVQFWTGAYEVETADAGTVVVPQDRWQGMSWRAGGIGWRSILAGLLGLAIFGIVTVGDALQAFLRGQREATSSR